MELVAEVRAAEAWRTTGIPADRPPSSPESNSEEEKAGMDDGDEEEENEEMQVDPTIGF